MGCSNEGSDWTDGLVGWPFPLEQRRSTLTTRCWSRTMWDSTGETLSWKRMLILFIAHSTAANDKLFRVDAVADRWGREGEVCSDTRTARASGSKDMALGPCFARHDSYNSKNSGELFKETTDADKFGMYLGRSRRCKCPCPRLTLQRSICQTRTRRCIWSKLRVILSIRRNIGTWKYWTQSLPLRGCKYKPITWRSMTGKIFDCVWAEWNGWVCRHRRFKVALSWMMPFRLYPCVFCGSRLSALVSPSSVDYWEQSTTTTVAVYTLIFLLAFAASIDEHDEGSIVEHKW